MQYNILENKFRLALKFKRCYIFAARSRVTDTTNIFELGLFVRFCDEFEVEVLVTSGNPILNI